MRIADVHHVSVNVHDVDEAVSFYVGVLGLSRRDDRPDLRVEGAWIDAGQQQVHLIRGDVPPSNGQHFALQVDALDTTIAELRACGVSVSDPSPIGTGRQAFLSDPSGNVIELHEPARTQP